MQTLHIMHRTPLVLATALLTSVSAFAQTEISTEAQLKAIAKDLNGSYVLTQNITLSDDEWTPIGTSDHPFTGTLDGKGHTIIGLTVGNGANNDSNNDKAFFGFTNGAKVQNIAFTSAVVKGHNQAAIVVAQATSSTLSNIYVSGVVTGRDHVGTIAGDARGTTDSRTTITNCVSTAAALSTEHQGGGIAGWTNNSTFSYNIAYGAVTAPVNGAGGITGMVDDNGKTEYISNISAAPYIKGDNGKTHGINGWCNTNCSNTGSNNLSWAGTEYYLGGTKKEATNINDDSGIHGKVTSTVDLKKAATYKGLGFNGDTWILEDGQSPRLKQFPNISDAVSISGLPDIITLGQTVTATSALNRSITITSSDPSIISVNGNTLKAEKYGTCNITITSEKGDFAEGASKTFIITVIPVVPELKVTYKIGDGPDVTSDVGTKGSLATLLGDKAMDVTQLSVEGYLNDVDIRLLQQMAGSTEGKGSLKSLDLSKATFTATGKKVPRETFQGCGNLQQVDLDGMTEIRPRAFKNCTALTKISIPASVTRIGYGAFAGNSKVTKVFVHSGTQIDARSYDGEDNIFSGMDPNKVQVVFKDAAEYNYKNYRNDINVGNNVYKNAFMYLLTKTLDENDDNYTVVAQRHADVLLKRTFKEGWNTLVLPFGARYLEGDTEAHDCSRIFQKALNASNTEGFMIAAYRGLAKNEAHPDNSTFYFLKYANYDEDPLDEFEPLLIRMTQKDINDANGVYIFKNVELNFDGDFKDPNNDKIKIYKEYTAAEAKERMGKRENGKYFDGSYDTEANDKFKKCSYDDFYFTGTLYKQDTDKNPAFIAPGDYIIQNNTFVKCLSGKKYGLKGFRGYFKQKPLGSSAKGNIGICLVDRNGVVSSIHQVDGASLTSASVAPVAVYNLSGQQVGNSLSTLAKGVYIVKGKKFVKK